MKTDQCVGSGMCCRIAPCMFGQQAYEEENKKVHPWDKKTGCRYLVKQGFQYRCGLFIGATPAMEASMTEAMGMGLGCSSTLFNQERNKILSLLGSSSHSPVSSFE